MSEERNSNDVEDKISIKEIHETFWRCRDFELSHLWQRSIKKAGYKNLAFCLMKYFRFLFVLLTNAFLPICQNFSLCFFLFVTFLFRFFLCQHDYVVYILCHPLFRVS